MIEYLLYPIRNRCVQSHVLLLLYNLQQAVVYEQKSIDNVIDFWRYSIYSISCAALYA